MVEPASLVVRLPIRQERPQTCVFWVWSSVAVRWQTGV